MDFSLTKRQEDIARAAREFAEGEFSHRAEELDKQETFDETVFRRAAELGFVGVCIAEKYGGQDLGIFENCLIVEEFSAVDLGMAISVLVTVFGSEVIQEFGTEEQKRQWLPPLTKGKSIMGAAFTEPDAGSDLAAASTTAIREGGDYVINGSKIFITNGNRANYLLCFVQTDPDNPDIHERHSMILVETHKEGFGAAKLTGKMGVRASDTAEISFNNVRVPCSNLVGKQGTGFYQAMWSFNRNRVTVAAQAVGLAGSALEESIKHVRKRKAFGRSLSSYQSIQFKLADMYTMIHAGRNLVHEAAWRIDQGRMDHRLIAAAKSFCGQMAVKCTDMALQMHGGYGYLAEYKVQRLFRDAKVLEIYEGTTEIERIIIARNLLYKKKG